MLKFFIENELISPNQSGLKPGDSCINQLYHEIYKSFDDGFEVRCVFLDISKAFDKVWREGLVFKWKQNGISGHLLNFLCDSLRNRKQRVLINAISIAISHPPLVFNNINVIQVISQKHLGIILDTWLSFEKHLETLPCKKDNTIGLPRKFQNLLPRTTLITLYKAFARLHLDYGDIIYDKARNGSFHEKLESFQYNVWLANTGAIRGSSREKLYQELGLNIYNNVVGIGNYVVSTRSLKTKFRLIHSI